MFIFLNKKYYTVFSWGFSRAAKTISQITTYIPKGSSVVDIGSGLGHVSKLLKDSGYKVTSLDKNRKPLFSDLNFVLTDGKNTQFREKQFDVSLLLTVLHHEKDPKQLFSEAARISRKIIIIEDVYTGDFQKYFTFFIDSLLNWEWSGHPHSNKSVEKWEKFFKENTYKITHRDDWTTLVGGILPIKQSLFCVEEE